MPAGARLIDLPGWVIYPRRVVTGSAMSWSRSCLLVPAASRRSSGPGCLLADLTRRLVERAMVAELDRVPGLRGSPGAAGRGSEHTQWRDTEDAAYRAWVGARHPGAPRRALRRAGRARPRQPRHRRGHGRRPGLAAAAAGGRLPDRVPRRPCDQGPRGGTVQRRACYLALGVTMDGDRDVLEMWVPRRTRTRSSGSTGFGGCRFVCGGVV